MQASTDPLHRALRRSLALAMALCLVFSLLALPGAVLAASGGPTPGPTPSPGPGPSPGPIGVPDYLPLVTITSPAQGTPILGHTVTVEGHVNVFPSYYADLTVNGNPVTVGIGGSFSTQVTFDWDHGPDFESPPEGALLPIVAEVWDTRLARNPTAEEVSRDRVTVIRGKGIHGNAKEFDAIELRVRKSLFDAAFADATSFVQNEYEARKEGQIDGNDYVAVGTVKDRSQDGLGEYGPKLILHDGFAEVRFDFDVDLDLSVDYGVGDCTADYDAWQGHIHWYFHFDSFDGNDIKVFGAGPFNPPSYNSFEVFIDDFHRDWIHCYGLYPGTALEKVDAATGTIRSQLISEVTSIAQGMDVFQKIEDAMADIRIEDALDDALSALGADVTAEIDPRIDPEGLHIGVDLGLGEPSDPAYEIGKADFIPYHFGTVGMRHQHPAMPCGSQGCWYTTPTTGMNYDIGMSTSPYMLNWYLRALAIRGDLDSVVYEMANPIDPSQQMALQAGLIGTLMLPGLLAEAPPTAELALEVQATASPYLTGRLSTPGPKKWIFALTQDFYHLIGGVRGTGGDVVAVPVEPGDNVLQPVGSEIELGYFEPLPGLTHIPEYELIVPDLRIRVRDAGFVGGYCGADDGVYLELAVDARLGLSLDRQGSELNVAVIAPKEEDLSIQVVRAPCGLNQAVLDDPDFLGGALYLPALVAEEFASVVQGIDVPGPFEISLDLGGAPLAMNDFLVHGAPQDLRPFVIFLGDPPLQTQQGQGNFSWWNILGQIVGSDGSLLDTDRWRRALDGVSQTGVENFDYRPFGDLLVRASEGPRYVTSQEWVPLLKALESAGPAPTPRPTLPDRDDGPPRIGDPDLDGDGVVGPADFFSAFRPCIGLSTRENPRCRAADLNSDGIVSALDFFQGLRPGIRGGGTLQPPKGVEEATRTGPSGRR